jgi:hypothetical protein
LKPKQKFQDIVDNPEYTLIVEKGSSAESYFSLATTEIDPGFNSTQNKSVKNI